jgi:hypothetical protein
MVQRPVVLVELVREIDAISLSFSSPPLGGEAGEGVTIRLRSPLT